MNKKLNLAVAAALALGATAAQAGIVIPAGDWTVDINGNVNAFYIYNDSSDANTVAGGLAQAAGANGSTSSSINTGLLPSWLGITGKKRENNLDISWTISFQPGASSKTGLGGGSGGGSEHRQANLTFGDKSWGSIKVGLDLGVFGANAILNDQTLLGVGSQGAVGALGGTTTTLGRIGTGFLYADFTGQINYTTPDFNGFQATAGIRQPWNTVNLAGAASAASAGNQDSPGVEGVVSYSWAGDFSGKAWVEGMHQEVQGIAGSVNTTDSADVFGVGASVNFSGFNLVGYYYNGSGVGTTSILADAFAGTTGNSRDSDGGYVQGKYKLPTGTTIAASWGVSNLDCADAADCAAHPTLVQSNEMWTVGAYHALTSNLNLVAEYSKVTAENQAGAENESDIFDIGAILFF
ncbi:MAG: porin [Methylophilales bacterium]|nr:porin [Methylophilales bacterium]